MTHVDVGCMRIKFRGQRATFDQMRINIIDAKDQAAFEGNVQGKRPFWKWKRPRRISAQLGRYPERALSVPRCQPPRFLPCDFSVAVAEQSPVEFVLSVYLGLGWVADLRRPLPEFDRQRHRLDVLRPPAPIVVSHVACPVALYGNLSRRKFAQRPRLRRQEPAPRLPSVPRRCSWR